MKKYTREEQATVADEKVAAEKTGARWPHFIDDYHQLRAACRAEAIAN